MPPIGKQKQYPALALTVIHACEQAEPKDRKKIVWKLITDLPVASFVDAVEKLEWYALRWKIETFHKIMKSGCRAEDSLLRTAQHRTFGIRYSVRGMTDWLHRQGFTFHQPCGVPAKADVAAQRAFIAEYDKIKASLGDEDQVLFLDGVHPSHAVRFMRGWIRKGQRREIPTNASQKRLNILGALNLEAMTLHRQEFDTLNADSVIAFLTYLLAAMPHGMLHLILDRGRYQHCEAVWTFAARNPRLKLHYLPPYSPNLNAIEPAWKIMHEYTTQNAYHPTFKAFTEKIRHFFNVIFPQNAKNWTDRLTDNFRVIAPNAHA